MCYSHASLEHVSSVQCFTDPCDQLCIGILLEYTDKRRASLGECRVKAFQDGLMLEPIAMYVKKEKVEDGSGVAICFVRDKSECPDEPGWECQEMKEELTWWFKARGVVEMIYS